MISPRLAARRKLRPKAPSTYPAAFSTTSARTLPFHYHHKDRIQSWDTPANIEPTERPDSADLPNNQKQQLPKRYQRETARWEAIKPREFPKQPGNEREGMKVPPLKQVREPMERAKHYGKMPDGLLIYQLPLDSEHIRYEPDMEQPIKISWFHTVIYFNEGRHLKSAATPHVMRATSIRDNCPCEKCRDPDSGQKKFKTTDIPVAMRVKSIRVVKDGIGVTFDREIPGFDDHEAIIPSADINSLVGRTSILSMNLPSPRNLGFRTGIEPWDKVKLTERAQSYDYDEYMLGKQAFWDVMIDLCRHGIAFLKDVPQDPDSIVRITERIANIKETFYGRTFDVRAKPNAENVAYTAGDLGLHQDLLYLDSPPKIQILHCMENSCEGGASLFADGDRIGRQMFKHVQASPVLRPLIDLNIPYAYTKHGYNYLQFRPVIRCDERGENFRGVWWSPPFQGRQIVPRRDMRVWVRAARVFDRLLNSPRSTYERTLKPGECVLFDNQRVLHGRRAFNAEGGSRWLRGAYIGVDDFYSKATQIPPGMAERSRKSQGVHGEMMLKDPMVPYMEGLLLSSFPNDFKQRTPEEKVPKNPREEMEAANEANHIANEPGTLRYSTPGIIANQHSQERRPGQGWFSQGVGGSEELPVDTRRALSRARMSLKQDAVQDEARESKSNQSGKVVF